MRIDTPTRYLQTIDEFIGHWEDVDAALAPGALVLGGGFGLAQLQSARDGLATTITALVQRTNVLEGHRTDRDNRKAPLRERMRQFRGLVSGLLAGSVYPAQLPTLVQTEAHSGKWIVAMDEFAHLWAQIEADPPAGFAPPLTLTGGYGLADFTADCAALKTVFGAVTTAEQDADRERDNRNALYSQVRERLVHYRQAVPGSFPSTHPLVTSLPRISPVRHRKPKPTATDA